MFNDDEIDIERICRSGPGGQHRNRKATGVRITHLPSKMVVMSTNHRSQKQNLDEALKALKLKLMARLKKPKKRLKTKPTKSSVDRRMVSKKRQGEKKKSRRIKSKIDEA